jgi:LPS-assembly lipoprotein
MHNVRALRNARDKWMRFSPAIRHTGALGITSGDASARNFSVPPLPNRKGMKLSRVLNEKLRPRGVSTGTAYDLEVGLSERIDELGIRKDATSSRANFVLTARFYLRESGRRVFGDQVQSIVSYNILDDQYATVASQANAEHRAIQQVGEQMKTRLAIYFHNRLNP